MIINFAKFKSSDEQKQTRFEFFPQMLNLLNTDADFFDNIIWTDESYFNTASAPNPKNTHFWSSQNPHLTVEIMRSGRVTLNVWCGIVRNKIIGPIFFEGALNGQRYNQLPNSQIDEIITKFPLNVARNFVWQHDGAPGHSVLPVREFLNQNYQTWIGRGGVIAWPANSPDLTPLDTFLWGYLKNKVSLVRPTNIDDMKVVIQNEIDFINNDRPDFIAHAIRNLKKRYRLCVEMNGGHIEHLLK